MTEKPAETGEVEAPSEDESAYPANFRKKLDEARLENKVKDSVLADMIFKHKGVDISKGMGKTARENYKGDLTEEAVLAYMSESYEWTPQPTGEPDAAQQQGRDIAQAQNRILATSQAPGTSSGNNEASLQEQIDAAEAKGDWTTTMRLKKQWFGQLMTNRRG